MSFWDKIVKNPFINPVGFVADKIRKGNGGDAVERVSNYDAPILASCNATLNSDCNFNGTEADWQDLRTNWINNCTTANNRGVGTSKNKTLAACQAAFDERAAELQLDIYAENKSELQKVQNLLSSSASPMAYLIVLAFVGIILYLLMSK